MKIILTSILILQSTLSFAQNDTTKKLTFIAYGEMYYSYDFANPQNHEKPNYLYNHKRHNEVNANLILAKAKYEDKNTRANLGLMEGNYAQYNLSAEPNWAQNIYEANAGIKISKNKNIWIDVGIMPSHIGFESAISADCWTLTRSMQAENSPYYETGVKLTYTSKNEKLQVATLYLNGWQKIQKPNNIQNPSFGTQINFKPTDKLILNYSSFISTDKPDSINALRIFHNIYCQYEPNKKIGFIVGIDIGTDKYNDKDYGTWFSPVIILRYTISEKLKIALRAENYSDKNQIIIPINTANGFKVNGFSTNMDYKINEKVGLRIEGKMYSSKDKIFEDGKKNNFCITTNMTIRI